MPAIHHHQLPTRLLLHDRNSSPIRTMGGPAQLPTKNTQVSFATWPTSPTEIHIRNLSSRYDAKVLLLCSGSEEKVVVAAGGDDVFVRNYNGFNVQIVNRNGVPVQVWSV